MKIIADDFGQEVVLIAFTLNKEKGNTNQDYNRYNSKQPALHKYLYERG
jgi:hypothetical protein